MQRHPNLRSAYKAPKARAVTRARINDDYRPRIGPLAILGHVATIRFDPQERVICRIFEATRVEDRLVIEIEQWRRVSLLVGKHVVCALAQHVKEQDAATEEISLIPRLLLQKRGAGMEI